MCTHSKNRGFTLIELMVVIAIIGIIASVILVSLQSSRQKAKDATVLTAVSQFKTLFNLEYSDTGSFANLQPNYNESGPFYSDPGTVTWIDSSQDCDTVGFAGNYASQARQLCKEITKHAPAGTPSLILGADANTSVPNAQYWTISVLMPLSQRYYCVSSLSRTSKNNTIEAVTDGGVAGCWNDTAR
jgi:prepilin-type N-terminal cleavage/methylation domain-containing protein